MPRDPDDQSSNWDRGWYERRRRLPGTGAVRERGRRPFGVSWWGKEWIDTLEVRARLDKNRLPRGRTYARTGAVGEIMLEPGEIRADVQGSQRRPYQVRVRVLQFSVEEWELVFDALAVEIGHTAALLDGELPAEVAQDVRSIGLDLLPGPGELQPRCSCPDWADPCKHSAAVCYLVADSLDDDPFGVFLLRGKSRDELLSALRSRRYGGDGAVAGLAGGAADVSDDLDAGVPARQAWAGWRDVSAATMAAQPLPAPRDPPQRAGRPTVLATDPPPGSGIDLPALRMLAADAAERALGLVHGSRSSGLELSPGEDLARRAARMLEGSAGLGDLADLGDVAARAGVRSRDLLKEALAFRDGGTVGLSVLTEAWDPGRTAMEGGATLLGPAATARRNRVTLDDRQVRLGRDGRWYPYRKERNGQWMPDGPPVVPVAAESDLGELEGDDS